MGIRQINPSVYVIRKELLDLFDNTDRIDFKAKFFVFKFFVTQLTFFLIYNLVAFFLFVLNEEKIIKTSHVSANVLQLGFGRLFFQKHEELFQVFFKDSRPNNTSSWNILTSLPLENINLFYWKTI